MGTLTFETFSEARGHFKDLLDAADRGQPALVRREGRGAAVVSAERLRHFLAQACPAKAQVVAEAGGWSVFIPGLPLAADGATLDEALGAMVDALREYADDWQDHLRDAPNHRDNWGLVQLVSLSDDAQLEEWLAARAAS
jgi:prevent-host-death family protein